MSERIEQAKKELFSAIEKPLNEMLAEFERRARGVDERLDRARSVVEDYSETVQPIVWDLSQLLQNHEVLDRLPPEWRQKLGRMREALRQVEARVKTARARDAW